MILLGGVHHALQRVDAAKAYDGALIVAQLLEALLNLITDEQIVGCSLLLHELQICQPGAAQHSGPAK